MSIYVEIRIRGDMEELWSRTQQPDLHERWDLRFSEIVYLPRPHETAPQRFRYAARIGFGFRICGEGESEGGRAGAGGERVSALKFWSGDAKSLILEVADVCERYDDAAGRFRIEVAVHDRRWGPLFGYRGSFEVEWREAPPGSTPAALLPVREEQRERFQAVQARWTPPGDRRYRRAARVMNAVTSASSGSTLVLPHQGQLAIGAAGVTLTWASSHIDPPSAPARDSAQSQFIAITSASDDPRRPWGRQMRRLHRRHAWGECV